MKRMKPLTVKRAKTIYLNDCLFDTIGIDRQIKSAMQGSVDYENFPSNASC